MFSFVCVARSTTLIQIGHEKSVLALAVLEEEVQTRLCVENWGASTWGWGCSALLAMADAREFPFENNADGAF